VHVPREGRPLAEVEREVVLRMLEVTGGNRSRAARNLEISRPKLLRMIEPAPVEETRT
jgi:DNA-binding NtrC family response regulator